MQRFSIRALASLAILPLLSGAAFAGVAVPPPVPEIDPGMATGGLALLAVGAVLLIERYRRR